MTKPFLLLFLCWMLATTASAQALRVVVVAAVDDQVLGTPCLSDVQVMTENFKQISKSLGYALDMKLLQKENFTSTAVRAHLQTLRADPNDVLMLYYTGHGYNHTENKSQYPLLKVNDYQAHPIALDEIHQALKDKGARLCVTMVDCCNDILPLATTSVSRSIRPRAITVTDDDVRQLLGKLFVEVKGDVKIAGAKRTHRSYAYQDGSLFTKTFESSFETALNNNSELTWKSLLEDVRIRMNQIPVYDALAKDTIRQELLYEVNTDESNDTPQTTIPFDEINQFLNALADESRPSVERQWVIKEQNNYFTSNAHVRRFVGATEAESQSIEQLASRLYLNARKIKQVNLIEKLSKFDPDKKRYTVVAVQEIWE